MGARQEVAEKIAKRYRESKDKAIKGQILDEFVEVTGYNRHYAARKLRTEHLKVRESKGTRKKRRKVKSSRGRKQVYGNRIRSLVETIWELMDYSCGKRLASMMEDVVDNMDRHGKLALTSEDHALLMQISPSTIDRMLSVVRKENGYKGRSHTQHGALLKEAIKIRTFADWVEQRPGFVEIDLVGHEGGQASGNFFFTLNMVDVNTGWVAMQAIKNKSQQATVEAIEKLRRRLPFPLLGIDCDNGSEFINAHLLCYCGKRKITFTRGRPYKKNDNCYVEQSNFVAVRSMMGYVRYEYPEEMELMNKIYPLWEGKRNHFHAYMKCTEKIRQGSKTKKIYSQLQTPYQRLLASSWISQEKKEELRSQHEALDIMDIHETIHTHLDALYQIQKKKRKEASPKEDLLHTP